VPDVSLNASGDHDGYLICSNGSCVNGFRDGRGSLFVVGGTSVSAPAFAGIVALLNQKMGAPQGNLNPILYGMAITAPQAFHDITSGGNQVPCRVGSVDCSTGTIGYSAGPGYDLASGIGSIHVANLIASWPRQSTGPGGPTTGNTPPATPSLAPMPISDVEQGAIKSGYAIITPDLNSAIPTPTVSFGLVSGGTVQSQASGTPASPTTDGSLFADVIPSIGRNLGVAMVNPGSSATLVTLTLKDKDGVTLGSTVSLSLGAHQQISKFISELFSGGTVGASLLGSLRIQSATPLSTLGLHFSGQQFSTLPIGVNTATSSGSNIVIPQFAMGGGWATQIALVNNSTTTLSGRISLFDQAGQPLSLKLNNATQSTFTYSVPSGGAFVLAPRDTNGQSPF
jgi:subtilase family serine protease